MQSPRFDSYRFHHVTAPWCFFPDWVILLYIWPLSHTEAQGIFRKFFFFSSEAELEFSYSQCICNSKQKLTLFSSKSLTFWHWAEEASYVDMILGPQSGIVYVYLTNWTRSVRCKHDCECGGCVPQGTWTQVTLMRTLMTIPAQYRPPHPILAQVCMWSF